MIKVSVIIPVYNITKYLTQALDSVFAQTLNQNHYEVILVDDGSEISVKDQLESYEHFHRIIFIHQPNKGLPSARNAGIKKSKGNFIVFLDADDMISSEKLERQYRILIDNPEASFVYSDAYRSNPYFDVVGRGIRTGKGSSYFDLFFDCATTIHAAMCRRLQVLDIGMFDERMLYNEDDDFWFRLSVNFGDAIYDDYISAYRRIHISRHSYDDLKVIYFAWKTVEKNSIEFKDALSSQWPRVKAWVKSMRLNYLFVKNSKETMLNHDKKYLKNNIQYVGNGVLERYFNYKALTFLGFMLRNRRRLLYRIMLQQLKEIILVS